MRPEQIHLKQRRGPVTDLRRKRAIATTANLMAAVGRKAQAQQSALLDPEEAFQRAVAKGMFDGLSPKGKA